MNAFARHSQEAKSDPRNAGPDEDVFDDGANERMPSTIFEIGRFTPITPVDITKDSFSNCFLLEFDNNLSVSFTIVHASSMPCFPVTAFAHPLLTITPRTYPPLRFKTSSETTTGAALNAFLVKHAAADVLCGEVDKITPRSSIDGVFLIPENIPPTRKPFGKEEEGRVT